MLIHCSTKFDICKPCFYTPHLALYYTHEINLLRGRGDGHGLELLIGSREVENFS